MFDTRYGDFTRKKIFERIVKKKRIGPQKNFEERAAHRNFDRAARKPEFFSCRRDKFRSNRNYGRSENQSKALLYHVARSINSINIFPLKLYLPLPEDQRYSNDI